MFTYCSNNPILFLDPDGLCRVVGPNLIKVIDCGEIDCKMRSISYNNQTVVENVNLKVKKGKITALIGLSGSGKTTILYRLGLINEDMTFDYEWEGKNLNK